MYCGKCGAENDNGAKFCTTCGAVINGDKEKTDNENLNKNSTSKNRKVGIVTAVVVAAVVIAVIVSLFGGRSYKSTVKKYFNASMKADAKSIVKLIPDEVIDKALQDEGYDKEDIELFLEEGEKELQKELDKIDEYIGDGWKMTYDIVETEDITGKDLKEVKEDYEGYDIDINAAKKVEVEVTVKAGDNENSDTTNLYLIKVGRGWYLDLENMGSLF